MREPRPVTSRSETALVDCWNSIGVRGDGSCPELERYVHCHHCPVYAGAAMQLLDSEISSSYAAEWTEHFAEPEQASSRDTVSVVIFRLGTEWLALPTRVVKEVGAERRIHSVPQRRGGVVLGVVNVHGELLVCASIKRILGLKDSPTVEETPRRLRKRLLVIRRDDIRVVCPVDEVAGIHRVESGALTDPPMTILRANTYSRKMLLWREHSVGVLDDQLLFYTLKRSLA